jgi:hypothetical protein
MQKRVNPDFISADGKPIYIETQVAECHPPIITHFMRVGNEPVKIVEWYNIHQVLHETYGIPENAIPDRYKPIPLLKHNNEDHQCCLLGFLKYFFN